MKIVVIGGTGLIGSKVVSNLVDLGHEVVAASPRSGVDTLTGEGLAEAVTGAQVVVDVSNSPSFDDDAVLHFFTASTRNLLAAEQAAGVAHHVALSVVGADGVPDSGYLRAKVAQENLIKESGSPYSIVRATQFFEFADGIAASATDGNTVRLPHALVQPIAAEDVATAVTRAADGRPSNAISDIAGPEAFGMDDFIRTGLAAHDDPRQVVTDPQARYFGAVIDDHSIVPGGNPTVFPTRFADWLAARGAVPTQSTWQTAFTVVQEVRPPFIPAQAEVMTVVVEYPPGDPGAPPHRHPGGPAFGYMVEGEMLFELEGEPPRIIRAGEAFWEPGGDVIHYRDGNNRTDIPSRFVVTMMCVPGRPMLELVDDEELARRKDRRVG